MQTASKEWHINWVVNWINTHTTRDSNKEIEIVYKSQRCHHKNVCTPSIDDVDTHEEKIFTKK